MYAKGHGGAAAAEASALGFVPVIVTDLCVSKDTTQETYVDVTAMRIWDRYGRTTLLCHVFMLTASKRTIITKRP